MNSKRSGRSLSRKVFSVVVDFFLFCLCSVSFLFSVTENKESALEAQNQLREEILGKLEDTNKNIDQVELRRNTTTRALSVNMQC